jgi:hypothetical protein
MPAAASVQEPSKPVTVRAPAKRVWLAWLLSPCILLVLHSAFVQARGPYYLGPNVDPEYPYLCNSLNMAVGRRPNHVDHPGTSLQLLGAAVITVAHPFAGKAEKIGAVLRRPEQHLRAINFVLLGVYAICIALVGITVWRRTGQWEAALVLQASPFLLGSQLPVVARVSAEALFITIGLLMSTLLFLEVRSEHTRTRTVGVLAFLAVAGVITKINFFPLACVPLAALRNRKQRATFLLWGGVFAFLWLLPLGSAKWRFFAWVKGLAFRQGNYGYGEPGILPAEYLWKLVRLAADHPWLCAVVGVCWATLIYGCIRWKQRSPQERRWLLLLGGLALGQTLQIAMVAKYGNPRYLLPSMMFCPLNLLLLIEFWRAERPPIHRIIFAATVIASLVAVVSLRPLYLRLAKTSAARMQLVRVLETDWKEEPKVFCYGSSSLYHALWFGNYWAGERYTKQLTATFGSHPPRYLVHAGSAEVRLMSEPRSLRDLESHPSFLLIGGRGATRRVLDSLPPNAKAKQVLARANEAIFHVTFE